MVQKNFYIISSYVGAGLAVVMLILLIVFTNQLNELKKYMPIAELDFSDNELYHVDFARIYAVGKGVAPNEKLQLNMHVTNKQNFTLQFQRDIIVYVGGEPSKHLLNPKLDEINGKSSKDLEIYDFYLAEEGPNEIRVSVRALFPNGTMMETEPTSTTIDVVSLSNQLQLRQNEYTSSGVIISATIGIVTVIALIASLHFSRKEIKSFESQNELFEQQNFSINEQTVVLQEQNTTLKEQASLQNRPWISVADEYKPEPAGNLFVIHLKNFGKTAATDMVTIDWAKDGIMTESELATNGIKEHPISVAPQETLSFSVPIKNLVGKINSEDIHIGFLIKYNYELVKEGKTLLIGYWSAANGRYMYRIKDLK